jgi:autotransporter-associated beta strand protein
MQHAPNHSIKVRGVQYKRRFFNAERATSCARVGGDQNMRAVRTLLGCVSSAALLAASVQAQAATFTAANQGQLDGAIAAANASSDPSSTILLTASFSVNSTSLATPTKPITIDTQGFTLSGISGTGTTNGNSLTISGAGGTRTLVGTVVGGSADLGGGGSGLQIRQGASVTNTGLIQGGTSLRGAGGPGVDIGGPGALSTFTNNGTVRGGSGATFGGVGVFVRVGAGQLINTGLIEGGNGQAAISANAAGVSINLINSGTIRAGAGQADAIRWGITPTTGTLTLELRAGSVIDGNVAGNATATGDTLRLAGATDWTLNVAQYFNFNVFQKVDSGTWTLTGTTTEVTPWQLLGGTLTVASDAALGDASGALTFNGGALATTASFEMMRQIVLTGDGVFRPAAGTALTLGTAMTGPGDVVLDGPGELILGAAQTYAGDTIINGGTLSAGAANVFSTTSAHNVMAGGTLSLTGFNQTLTSLDNAGTVNLGGAPGTTLTVSGNYVGSGGTLQLNTQLEADNSPTDQLIIGTGGSASGVTGIIVTNVGGAGAQTMGAGIPVVLAQAGATTAVGAFTLAAPVGAGPFQYLLFRGNDSGPTGDPNTWYLRSHCEGPDCPQPGAGPTAFYRPETSIYGTLPGMARALAISTVSTFHERYGDQDAVRSGGGRAWGRVFGEHNEQGSTGALSSSFEGWLGGVQLGIDAFRWRGDDGSQDAGGFFFTLAKADGDVHGNVVGVADAYAGSSDLSGPSFGAYYTHIPATGTSTAWRW